MQADARKIRKESNQVDELDFVARSGGAADQWQPSFKIKKVLKSIF